MRTPGLRDYLYISVRKTERMAATLPPRTLKRLKGMSFNAGVFGAGVELSDAEGQGVIAAVSAVEEAIRKEHHVRHVFDEDVRVGHWVSASGMSMAYGIPVGLGPDAEMAVFAGAEDNSHLVLSGSAQYLLDRDVAPTVHGSGSEPAAIAELLDAAAPDPDDEDEDLTQSPWIEVEYSIPTLLSVLSRNGLHPLTFLARVIHVSLSEGEDPRERYVVGTPLFVALDVPE